MYSVFPGAQNFKGHIFSVLEEDCTYIFVENSAVFHFFKSESLDAF